MRVKVDQLQDLSSGASTTRRTFACRILFQLLLLLWVRPGVAEDCSCTGPSCTASLARTAERYEGAIAGSNVVTGKGESFSIGARRFTVIAFLSARCPCSASHEVALARLAGEFSPKGVRFIGVHSNADEPPEMTTRHFEQARLPFSVLQDSGSQLANTLGALKTPHVYLLNQSGEALYQGGVDDSSQHENSKRPFLREALAAVIAGQAPPVKVSRVLGCVIKR